jgi:hypothetical protein
MGWHAQVIDVARVSARQPICVNLYADFGNRKLAELSTSS